MQGGRDQGLKLGNEIEGADASHLNINYHCFMDESVWHEFMQLTSILHRVPPGTPVVCKVQVP